MTAYAYYNENEPFAAEWLRELIDAGHIAPGVVDTRSIEDVRPFDLEGFTQCHFFAGIGVWSYALRLAGWPDDRPVWTASCPCQPFSQSGRRSGLADERHLWPHFYWLASQRRPSIILGEQVASKAAEPWFDLVQADLEGLDYAFGCVPFPSAGVGAPHIRDRAYWVADSCGPGLQERISDGRIQRETVGAHSGEAVISCRDPSRLGNPNSNGRGARSEATEAAGHRNSIGAAGSDDRHNPAGPTNGFWRDSDWLLCRDGKWRPVEPGTFPLVDGTPARVGRLRGYGNAINAEAARVFIETVMGI